MAELLSFARMRPARRVSRKTLIGGWKSRYFGSYSMQPLPTRERGAISRGKVLQVIELATGGLKPDLTLFFDISVGEAIKRCSRVTNAGQKEWNG